MRRNKLKTINFSFCCLHIKDTVHTSLSNKHNNFQKFSSKYVMGNEKNIGMSLSFTKAKNERSNRLGS